LILRSEQLLLLCFFQPDIHFDHCLDQA
jgi:hypothetical protein